MTIKLAKQPGYHFTPLSTPAELAALDPYGETVAFYDVATNVGSPIAPDMLRRLVQGGDLMVWRMDADDGQAQPAYVTLSRYASAEQAYVFCPQGWDNCAVAAGLEALSQAVFAADPACQDIWVGLPLPHPADSEETLLIMGFTYTPSSLDFDVRRTFGLSRQVFDAYHA